MEEGKDMGLDFAEREIVLRADFEHLDDEGYVSSPLRFMLRGPRHPDEGEWVFLIDPRGRSCLGCVEEINGWSARIRPDWDTWSGAGPPPPLA